MLVGGFLYRLVVPGVLRIVGPLLHIGEHVVLVGSPVQHTVDNGHNLRTGDIGIRVEGVAVSVDPSGFGGQTDLLGGPVVRRVGEVALAVVHIAAVQEPRRDHRELRTGDVGVGIEDAAVAAALQSPGPGAGGDGVVVPVAFLHISEGVDRRPVGLAVIVRHETEEDGSHLRAADVVQRADGAVLVADDVGEVVRVVQAHGSRQRHFLIDDSGAGIKRRLGVGNGGGAASAASAGISAAGGSRVPPPLRGVNNVAISVLSPHPTNKPVARANRGAFKVRISFAGSPCEDLIRKDFLAGNTVCIGYSMELHPLRGNGDVSILVGHRISPSGKGVAGPGGISGMLANLCGILGDFSFQHRGIGVAVFPSNLDPGLAANHNDFFIRVQSTGFFTPHFFDHIAIRSFGRNGIPRTLLLFREGGGNFLPLLIHILDRQFAEHAMSGFQGYHP